MFSLIIYPLSPSPAPITHHARLLLSSLGCRAVGKYEVVDAGGARGDMSVGEWDDGWHECPYDGEDGTGQEVGNCHCQPCHPPRGGS